MNIDSLRDVEGHVADIAAGLTPVLADLGAVLSTGSATDADLGRLNAALEDARDDLRDLRDVLGGVDVADHQIGTDAGDRLRLWDWQLDNLNQLRGIAGQALDAQTLIGELSSGRQPTTHEVRAGETLQSIAQQRLGDWQEWTRLLEPNALDPAQPLLAGTVLVIPERR